MSTQLDNQPSTKVLDTLKRPLQDLRISVIDRCNFRCTYCMPESHNKDYTFLNETKWLTFDEITRLAELFVSLGVTKVRLTGGEPLLRPNLTDLVKQLRSIEGIKELALTSNGSLLSQQAQSLKDAGLDRITISLDALDKQLFHQMNGGKGSVKKVLKGIEACVAAGFDNIKVNAVLQKNINDHQILDLAEYFKGQKPILRFIEYMDVGNCNHWNVDAVVPAKEALAVIHKKYPLEVAESNYFGEVAARYRYQDGSGEVGFITSVTQPFCQSCTRVRLSTDGKVYTCLFASQGTDLRTLLRQNRSDEDLLNAIQSIWHKRQDRYSELRSEFLSSTQNAPKVEMFQIGG